MSSHLWQVFFFPLPEIFSKTFDIKSVRVQKVERNGGGDGSNESEVSCPQKLHGDLVLGGDCCLIPLSFPFSPNSPGPRADPHQYLRELFRSPPGPESLLKQLHLRVGRR